MLLCRQAENVFWLGRYLERAEDISRAAIAYTELCLDMPQPMAPSFEPLLALTLDEEPEANASIDRDQVLLVLLHGAHDGSVRSLIESARENLRVSRAIVPEETWTSINEAHEALASADPLRRGQPLLAQLESVGRTCQLISAQITDTMTRDFAYAFLDVGRYLERANMLLRILQMSQRMHSFDAQLLFDDVRFMGVLQCLGAQQMFRRRYQGRTSAKPVLTFLLKDADFPRSLAHCLVRIDRAFSTLPASGSLRQQTEELMAIGLPRDPAQPDAYAEHLLEALAELSDATTRSYFQPEPTPSLLRFTAQG